MNASKLLRGVLPIAVLLVGVGVAATLIATKPEPQKVEQRIDAVPVATVPARFVEQNFSVAAMGVVQPAREVVVQPQVSGVVVESDPRLEPGGRFASGEVLFRIDPTDYRLAVETARTRLAEAEANLELEKGRQEVARREWALFADESDGTQDPGLALREPQLRAANAAVEAAAAQLRQAEANLARTVVRAPFNAVVRAESVELGQTLSPQSQAARLIGTDTFRVQASIPVDRLGYVAVAGKDGEGSEATIRYDAGTGTVARNGRVVRVLSDLDPQGQMARVLIEIEDPLATGPGAETPMLLDSFVDVEIDSTRSARVVELPRRLLRDGDRVHIFENGQLVIRSVDVAWRREDSVLVAGGLSEGDRIVTTSLAAPLAGMRLRDADTTSLAADEANAMETPQ